MNVALLILLRTVEVGGNDETSNLVGDSFWRLRQYYFVVLTLNFFYYYYYYDGDMVEEGITFGMTVVDIEENVT